MPKKPLDLVNTLETKRVESRKGSIDEKMTKKVEIIEVALEELIRVEKNRVCKKDGTC